MKGHNSIVAASLPGSLQQWLHTTSADAESDAVSCSTRLRFAFYGRVSTSDRQESITSYRWQRHSAERSIAGTGTIVREFFDPGFSRTLDWHARPQARALLQAVTRPDRDFDAIVVGEFDRAFSGRQLLRLASFLQRHNVTLWLPELAGPYDHSDPVHRAFVMLLGHRARSEVLKTRFRVSEAMRVQVVQEGRFVGGRLRTVTASKMPVPTRTRNTRSGDGAGIGSLLTR
jgi:DNA invertase Pin-like site-specific DNA recombinase